MGEMAEDFAYMKEQRAKERAAKEPRRMEYALKQLREAGYHADAASHNEIIILLDDGWSVKFWPFTGWHTGKTIQDGRGLKHLLDQLEKNKQKTIDNLIDF